jgi:hypothetical protein
MNKLRIRIFVDETYMYRKKNRPWCNSIIILIIHAGTQYNKIIEI